MVSREHLIETVCKSEIFMPELNGLMPRITRPASGAPIGLPAGVQSQRDVSRRRWSVLALNLMTYTALMSAAWVLMAAGGWTLVDGVMFACFAIGTPWAVLGFWNAVIGLWLLHVHRDPVKAVAPFVSAGDTNAPVASRVAVLMTLRNEKPDRALERLRTVKASIDATGQGDAYSYFILSDTDDDEVATAEELGVSAWRAADADRERIFYRRRTENTGFKAGNVRDFLERWGQDYTFMLPLDADSVMSGDTIVRMTRMGEAHPRIGILQSLVVGMPSQSAFARIFQFGMRHGMRSYTMGQAWWVADCGPFWGHNALVRTEPFKEACELPVLPGRPPLGGHVLSHDQVEATFMRRAGYEVRVIPFEMGSWEENPPTMLDFAKRDVRWCQGNMQYGRLIAEPGLKPMSRFQLAWAMLMFLGVPAWTLMIGLLPVAAYEARSVADYPTGLALALYAAFFGMYLSPKFAGFLDAALTKGEVARFGGAWRFGLSAGLELIFSFLQGAVSSIRTTIFMVGLALGVSVRWGGQDRDAHGIAWSTAFSHLWPQTVFGLIVCSSLLLVAPSVFWWSLPLTLGYLVAVPFAVITAEPWLGRLMQSWRLCAIPEEFAPPAEILAIARPVDEPVTPGFPVLPDGRGATPVTYNPESR